MWQLLLEIWSTHLHVLGQTSKASAFSQPPRSLNIWQHATSILSGSSTSSASMWKTKFEAKQQDERALVRDFRNIFDVGNYLCNLKCNCFFKSTYFTIICVFINVLKIWVNERFQLYWHKGMSSLTKLESERWFDEFQISQQQSNNNNKMNLE